MNKRVVYLSEDKLLVIDENNNTKCVDNSDGVIKELMLENELKSIESLNESISHNEEEIADCEFHIDEKKEDIANTRRFALGAPFMIILGIGAMSYFLGDTSFMYYGLSLGTIVHVWAGGCLIHEKHVMKRYHESIASIADKIEAEKRELEIHKRAILALDDSFIKYARPTVNLERYQNKLYDKITANDLEKVPVKTRKRTLK